MRKNENPNWPEPQLQAVENGMLSITNNTSNAVLLGSQVKMCKITTTTDTPGENERYYQFKNTLDEPQPDGIQNLQLISHNRKLSSQANKIIEEAHMKYSSVFKLRLGASTSRSVGRSVGLSVGPSVCLPNEISKQKFLNEISKHDIQTKFPSKISKQTSKQNF